MSERAASTSLAATKTVFNPSQVAAAVQALATDTNESIAPLVCEALQVIDEALDTHGYVSFNYNFLET